MTRGDPQQTTEQILKEMRYRWSKKRELMQNIVRDAAYDYRNTASQSLPGLSLEERRLLHTINDLSIDGTDLLYRLMGLKGWATTIMEGANMGRVYHSEGAALIAIFDFVDDFNTYLDDAIALNQKINRTISDIGIKIEES